VSRWREADSKTKNNARKGDIINKLKTKYNYEEKLFSADGHRSHAHSL